MLTNGSVRIAVTGGPGGGKTTAADLFRRELGECVVVVPESATMLFMGGYPRYSDHEALRATQRAIYHVQRGIELGQAHEYPKRILICDRGTIDGAAYWPDGPDDFFRSMGTTLEQELDRYNAVLFFETAAVGGLQIEGGNPARTEEIAEAADLDGKLRRLWSQHEHFTLIPHSSSFMKKINSALEMLTKVVRDFGFDP